MFNTHLHSQNPKICEQLDKLEDAKADLALLLTFPGLGLAKSVLQKLLDADLHCGDSDTSIQNAQLVQMNSFIESVAVEKDRPAIVMGDFNIDGKKFGDRYCTILDKLRIGPNAGAGSAPCVDGSAVNPWPDAFDWDVDFGDVVRERPGVDFGPTSQKLGKGTGTFIRENDGTIVSGFPFAGNFDGVSRIDYIFVRPPHPPDSPSFEAASWVVARDTDEVWQSPFPAINAAPGAGPPERLSDHKPVVSSLRFFPLAVPGQYHHDWKHSITMRVKSVDASNKSDCSLLCGDLDLFTKNTSHARTSSGEISVSFTGSECKGETASYPHRGCMSDWSFTKAEVPANELGTGLTSELWERDDTSPDDEFPTTPGNGHPKLDLTWSTGLLRLINLDNGGTINQRVFHDNDPQSLCSRSRPARMCLRAEIEELGPGMQ